MIKIEEYSGEVTAVTVGGERMDSDEGQVWITLVALLRPYKVPDLPDRVSFALCKEVQEDIVVLDSL